MAAKHIFVLALYLLSVTKAIPIYTPEPNATSSTPTEVLVSQIESNTDNNEYLVKAENNEEPGSMITFIPKYKLAKEMAVGLISNIAFYTLGAFTSLATIAIGCSILCTFTSICFNYEMWFNKMENKEVTTVDSLMEAENAVNEAIARFKKLQSARFT